MVTISRMLVVFTSLLLVFLQLAHARELSFAERVDAQAAIERVYHEHREGSATAFERAVPVEVLERKVRDYLAASKVLEEVWNTPVTAAALERELNRIASRTQAPDRLQEIYDALSGDSFLIQECFVRPVLVRRLVRNFSEGDRRLAESDDTVGSRFDIDSVPAVASRAYELPSPARGGRGGLPESLEPGSTTCPPADSWLPSEYGRPEERFEHKAVWTGSEMIVWGGRRDTDQLGSGGRYDPVTDTWMPISEEGAPDARFGHSAVWTGSEMIVWGGASQFPWDFTDTGARYDPVSDSWTPTSTTGSPSIQHNHSAVWTGSEMIVWGTSFEVPDVMLGGRYDPAADSWTPVSANGQPSTRSSHTAVWTGTEMIVWGGHQPYPVGPLDTGGRYDPVADSWTETNTTNAPALGWRFTAIWTASEMIVWGGHGGRYDPTTDSWTLTTTVGAPFDRAAHTAVWTGSEMIIWGGGQFFADYDAPTNTGGSYDPVHDSWQPTPTDSAPFARINHAAVWTGSRMIVWGGNTGYDFDDPTGYEFDSGGRFDPETDGWTPTSLGQGPPSLRYHTAVWTGAEMIVWGGLDALLDPLDLGGRYDPIVDSWVETSTTGAPDARSEHTAIWTGAEMIVWGGRLDGGVYLNSGGGYDPVADAWNPTSSVFSPEARRSHTAVWTGEEMIVWGGFSHTGVMLGRGGRYDPVHDSWLATSNTGAPSPRMGHTAVWTGTEMIVWGGETYSVDFDTGGRYDPVANTWTATPTVDVPDRRASHTAVWTGEEMIVWGGMQQDDANDPAFNLDTGGRLDPFAGVWTPTTTTGAPSGRRMHTAVWTGDEMIVWGGGSSYWDPGNNGGRYAPGTDTWSTTSLVNVPHERTGHTAVWTGELMIIWGGVANSGGLYLAGPSVDADLDGFCDFADCDDLDGQIWATPGEVRDLVFESDAVTLSWSPPDAPGGTIPLYDVLRSPDASDFSTAADCLVSDEPDEFVADPTPPPSGGALHYLVRARNGCALGLGSLGTDSEGSARAGRNCP